VTLPDQDPAGLLRALPELFAREHERTYGFRAPLDEPVEIVGLSVTERGIPDRPRLPPTIAPAVAQVPPYRRAWFAATGWIEVPVIDRTTLAGPPRQGPLIVQEYDATCLVPHDAVAELDAFGNIRLGLAAP
jgi:N-methylhydantoinase A